MSASVRDAVPFNVIFYGTQWLLRNDVTSGGAGIRKMSTISPVYTFNSFLVNKTFKGEKDMRHIYIWSVFVGLNQQLSGTKLSLLKYNVGLLQHQCNTLTN